MGLGDIVILTLVAAGLIGAVWFICKNGGFAGSCGGDCAHCMSGCEKRKNEPDKK